MTTQERAARNAEVVRARLRGLGESEVARRCGVSVRHVRRILAEHRKSRPALDDIDPMEVIRGAIDANEAGIEELAFLAEQTTNASVKLGAIRARMQAQRAKIELLQAAGVLPLDLRYAGAIENAQETGRVLVSMVAEELERAGVPDAEHVHERIMERTLAALHGREEPIGSADNGRPS